MNRKKNGRPFEYDGNPNARSNCVDRFRTSAVPDQLGGGVTDPKKFAAPEREEALEEQGTMEGSRRPWQAVECGGCIIGIQGGIW